MEIGLISLLGFEARTIGPAAWSLYRLPQYCEWPIGLLLLTHRCPVFSPCSGVQRQKKLPQSVCMVMVD